MNRKLSLHTHRIIYLMQKLTNYIEKLSDMFVDLIFIEFRSIKICVSSSGKILAFLACGYLFVSQSILGFRKKGPDEKLSEFSALSS